MRKVTLTLALLIGLSFPGAASATLVDLGGGLIYDDVLDVTWLQDASLGGDHTWPGAVAWAASLVFGGAEDWRLPSISVAAGLPTGSTNTFFNCAVATELECQDNELGYMLYYNLGGPPALGDVGDIENIQAEYWSGTEVTADDRVFVQSYTGLGVIAAPKITPTRAAWAVHAGMVPEPGTGALLGLGLAGLGAGGRSRRRESKATN